MTRRWTIAPVKPAADAGDGGLSPRDAGAGAAAYRQYGSWLWRALHLDFGVSFAPQRPVLDDMLRLSARHAAAGRRRAGVILLTSVPLGIWAARRRDRLPDFIVRIIAFLGVSCPTSGWLSCW